MKLHYWRCETKLNLHDVWIGLYWKRFPCAIDLYLCIIPCLPINLYIQWHPTNK